MDNIVNNDNLEPKKKMSLKSRIILIEAMIIIVLVGIGWTFMSDQIEKKKVVNENLKQLETLNKEKARCGDLVSQQSGDFDQYEYCRQLLQNF